MNLKMEKLWKYDANKYILESGNAKVGRTPVFLYLCREPSFVTIGVLSSPRIRATLRNAARIPFWPGMAVFKPIYGPFVPVWYKLSFCPENAVKSKIREN